MVHAAVIAEVILTNKLRFITDSTIMPTSLSDFDSNVRRNVTLTHDSKNSKMRNILS